LPLRGISAEMVSAIFQPYETTGATKKFTFCDADGTAVEEPA
jgi:hypothetical protein